MGKHLKYQSDLFDKSKSIVSQYLKMLYFVTFGHLLNYL